MDSNVSEMKRAEEWLKMTAGKWRLQTMQHRGRYNPTTGTYKDLPIRIRRFLNGTPVSNISRTLEILKKSAPYSSKVFNWENGDDLSYMPTRTLIRKDGAEFSTNTGDATYTIIQDLKLVDDAEDSLLVDTESSCSKVEETEFFWDETDVADCPQGSQGVSYQVSAVSRDTETDLFSYQVRKVTAITQHLGERTISCTEKARVTEETWDNVYGTKDAYKYDSVTGGGAAIALPTPCSQPNGTSVEISVQENPDCTFKIVVRKTTAFSDVNGAWSYYRDQFKWQETLRTFNATTRYESGITQSGGVTKKLSSEMNDDGTFTNVMETDSEKTVLESSWEKTVTPRGVRITYVNTNVTAQDKSVPSGDFGHVKTTKTPGGLFVNEYMTFERAVRLGLGSECEKTAYRHTHGSTSSASAIDTSDVPAAGSGRIYSRSFSMDNEGFITKNDRYVQEITEKFATRSREVTASGIRTTYRHRGDPVLPNLNFSTVGKSVSATLTDGKWWDWEETEFAPNTNMPLGTDCEKTIFSHGHTTSRTVASAGSEASSARGGKTYRLSYSVNEQTGVVTERSSVTTELAVADALREVRRTARSRIVTVRNANQASPGTEPSGAGESVTNEKTQGGLYNVTIVTVEPNVDGPVGSECKNDVYSHSHSDVQMYKNRPSTGHVPTASGGKVNTISDTLGEDGLWQRRSGYTQEHTVLQSRIEYRVTGRGRYVTKTDTAESAAETGPTNTTGNIGKAVTTEKTPGGMFTNTVTTFEHRPGEVDLGADCRKTAFEHVHSDTTNKAQKPSPADVTDAANGVIRERTARLDEQTNTWDVVERETTELKEKQTGSVDYTDAFGSSKEDTYTNWDAEDGGSGGARFTGSGTAAAEIQHLRRQMTPGKRTTVQVTVDKPVPWDSGWINVDRPSGNAKYHWSQISFRNKTRSEVIVYINVINDKNWVDGEGTYSVQPNVNISPNKFGLLDGSVSISCRYTPAGFAVGCRKSDVDDPFEVETTYVDVQYQPIEKPHSTGSSESVAEGKVLAVIRTEKHLIGSGVGFNNFKNKFNGKKRIKGSQFHFNPAGENFTYDIITECKTEFKICDQSHEYPVA